MYTRFGILAILIGAIVIGGMMITSIFKFGAFSSYRKINEEKTYATDGINEIRVSMSSIPVHVIRSEADNEMKIDLYGEARREIKLVSEISRGTVFVEVRRECAILPIPEDVVMDIHIPEKYGKSLSIKISSGIVKLDSIDLSNFTLTTSSGGLKADNLAAEKISIITSSGNINVKKVDARELTIKGSSSNIDVDECNAEEASIGVSSGNVALKNAAGSLDLKVSSGDVRVSYREFIDPKVRIRTTSGNIALALPATAEVSLAAETTSGKIQSDFPISSAGYTEGQTGMLSGQVSLKATSGSIKVTKK